MGTKNIEKRIEGSGDLESVKKIQLGYDGATLTAAELRTEEDGTEIAVPYLVQPWKCNPDGTIESFTSEADAFAWAEANLYLF